MLDTDNHKSGKGPICRVLGIGAADSTLRTKFCAVFPMGTGMDDIADFREFIYHYIFFSRKLTRRHCSRNSSNWII